MVSTEWRWSYEGKFIFDTDISDTHVGAELMLIQDEEEKNLIALSEEVLYDQDRATGNRQIYRQYRRCLLRRPLFELTILV